MRPPVTQVGSVIHLEGESVDGSGIASHPIEVQSVFHYPQGVDIGDSGGLVGHLDLVSDDNIGAGPADVPDATLLEVGHLESSVGKVVDGGVVGTDAFADQELLRPLRQTGLLDLAGDVISGEVADPLAVDGGRGRRGGSRGLSWRRGRLCDRLGAAGGSTEGDSGNEYPQGDFRSMRSGSPSGMGCR